MRSHNLRRLEALQPTPVQGLWVVEDLTGADTVSVTNAMQGVDNEFPRDIARAMTKDKPTLWITGITEENNK